MSEFPVRAGKTAAHRITHVAMLARWYTSDACFAAHGGGKRVPVDAIGNMVPLPGLIDKHRAAGKR
jgi:hypothetical protein